MYINFQQNRVGRSVTTVHTDLFENSRKLHKFATTNGNFKKNKLFQTCNLQQNRISRSPKNEDTNIFSNNRKLHKFAICYSNFETKRLLAEVFAEVFQFTS